MIVEKAQELATCIGPTSPRCGRGPKRKTKASRCSSVGSSAGAASISSNDREHWPDAGGDDRRGSTTSARLIGGITRVREPPNRQ